MDAKQTQTGTDNHLGITFGEIHSDEPHEAVKASNTEVAQKHTASPQSLLSNKDDVFNVTRAYENGHLEAGTIVSDKKDSRPSVGANIRSAFSEWWGSAKNTLDDSATKIQAPLMKKEEPVISSVENRAEIVKTAATHATMAPKDDHHMVIQKIRTFKQDVARVQNAPIIVKEQSEQKGGWTHTEQKPAEPAKKIELEKFVASVASPQQMIPTPPQKEKALTPSPIQSTPIPPVPRANIPKPPQKVTIPPKPNVTVNTIVTPLKREEAPLRSTSRMNVPDTVVKKDISLPKKNIWVAPRIQPESSVLVPHNTPIPVSQSFIPSQNPLPQKAPAVAVPPAPIAVPFVEVVPPAQSAPLDVPIKTADQGLTKPFHSTSTQTPVDAQKVDAVKPVLVPVTSVPQHSTPPSITIVSPQSVPPVPKPIVPEVAKITVPVPVPKVIPPMPIPVSVAPLQVTKPIVASEPQKSFVSAEQPPRSVPPQILKSSLYKKAPIEPVAPSSVHVEEHLRAPLHAPTPLIPTTPAPHLQEIPKHTTPETGGYANEIHTPIPAPMTFRAPEETPRVASVPLPRPAPIVPPHPIVETRPVQEDREIFKTVEATPAPFIPRTPTPTSSVPVALPPLERVILSPVSEDATTTAPSNKAFRTFVRWAIIVLIILTGIALALFASIYFNVFKKETPLQETPVPVPTFIKTSTQTPLVIEGTKETFLTALKEKVRDSGAGLTQFYPTMREGEATRPGSSAEILGFLNTHLDERTRKSLSPTIMMGSITTTKNEPFVVIQSTNFDVLFTGLLAWEPNLYTDFAPLFGENAPTKIKFKDAVRDNTSTRILYDDAGNEILLYSFINQKTVVITTSGEALSELIKQF